MKNKNQKGFTLVELLVVIAIIGILATLLLLQLGVARSKARDAKRIADINQVRTAIELYFDDNGSYPQVATYSALATPLIIYLTQLPQDSFNSGAHIYKYAYNSTIRFHLSAELELKAVGALQSDLDFNSITAGWTTGQTINGAAEACAAGGATIDCVYDTGQTQ